MPEKPEVMLTRVEYLDPECESNAVVKEALRTCLEAIIDLRRAQLRAGERDVPASRAVEPRGASDHGWDRVTLDKENYRSMRGCLHGMTLEPDRLWRIVIPEQLPGAISEYNWEVTGVSSNLIAFLRYGANAYHFLFTLCPQLGWKVEEVHVES